jgi:hypothetical protein
MTVYVVVLYQLESGAHFVEGVYRNKEDASLACMRVLETFEGPVDAEVVEREVK